MTLRLVRSIEDTPGMPAAIAAVVTASAGKVCAVCGLERMGHGPESEWLGYDRHPWDGVPATPEMIERAAALTSEAYRRRRAS